MLPLFNRIVLQVLSVGLLVGCLMAAFTAMRGPAGVQAGEVLLWIVFTALGCGGLGISVFWKNHSSQELRENASRTLPALSTTADQVDDYCFQFGQKAAAVRLDFGAKVIHFRNCHVERKFLAGAAELYTCALSEVRAVHRYRYRGDWLIVLTPHGKASIPKVDARFERLHAELTSVVPQTRTGYLSHHPLSGLIYLVGTLAGMAAGVGLTPQNFGDTGLVAMVLAGGSVGAVASLGVVRILEPAS